MLSLGQPSILQIFLPTLLECEHSYTLKTSYHTFLLPWLTYRSVLRIIPDGVETTSGVSLSVYPLTAIITNYLAPVLYKGSLTRQTEDGYSSLVGSIENSTCNSMLYSCLPALLDLSSGSQLWVSSLGLHPLPPCPFLSHPLQLLGIVTFFIPYPSL